MLTNALMKGEIKEKQDGFMFHGLTLQDINFLKYQNRD